MSEDAPTTQLDGPTYRPRIPAPTDLTVTPATMELELRALSEGWSRNVWAHGRSGHALHLWPRYFHDVAPLTMRFEHDPATRMRVLVTEGGEGTRLDRQSPESLARYMWSFDPARYTPPEEEPLPLWRRLRAYLAELRPTRSPCVPFRAVPPPLRRWSALDEGGPLDGGDG